ncbi:hypothetical protein C8Q70DRAFT_1122181 [Cubamyces menziesii]|nr:hypothetical protein C8Q70DRAFT_1122181 [Cubamyces menziesii]
MTMARLQRTNGPAASTVQKLVNLLSPHTIARLQPEGEEQDISHQVGRERPYERTRTAKYQQTYGCSVSLYDDASAGSLYPSAIHGERPPVVPDGRFRWSLCREDKNVGMSNAIRAAGFWTPPIFQTHAEAMGSRGGFYVFSWYEGGRLALASSEVYVDIHSKNGPAALIGGPRELACRSSGVGAHSYNKGVRLLLISEIAANLSPASGRVRMLGGKSEGATYGGYHNHECASLGTRWLGVVDDPVTVTVADDPMGVAERFVDVGVITPGNPVPGKDEVDECVSPDEELGASDDEC